MGYHSRRFSIYEPCWSVGSWHLMWEQEIHEQQVQGSICWHQRIYSCLVADFNKTDRLINDLEIRLIYPHKGLRKSIFRLHDKHRLSNELITSFIEANSRSKTSKVELKNKFFHELNWLLAFKKFWEKCLDFVDMN